MSRFDELATTADDVTVQVAFLALSKSVTPTVTYGDRSQRPVTYTIVASGGANSTAVLTGVIITDALPSGFVWQETVSVVSSGLVTRTSTVADTSDVTQPWWGTWDVAPNGVITIVIVSQATNLTGQYTNTVRATNANGAPREAVAYSPVVTVTTSTALRFGQMSVAASSVGWPIAAAVAAVVTGLVAAWMQRKSAYMRRS